MKKEDFEIKLEQHDTKDVSDGHVNGSLTVVWRDWDKIIKNNPKMVYVSSVNPNEIKDPHLHKKRNSYFLCIEEKVILLLKMGMNILKLNQEKQIQSWYSFQMELLLHISILQKLHQKFLHLPM